ncbi:MAG: UDP-N-acetylmuramate--L-alanine ligase [Planctomycetota bacterium]|jgi:UDP-N-acetylmuramate--alanine ligase
MVGSTATEARNIHFVGIGGIGMSGLARILREKGYRVSGTDLGSSPILDGLSRAGVSVRLGHSPDHIPEGTSLVVHTAAVTGKNLELQEAGKRRIRVARYSEVLGALMREKIGIAVAGTHGKTTTTAMVTHILSRAGFDPSFLVGGMAPDLGGNARLGYGVHFVAEACEYAASFHDLVPKVAVLNNLEADHMDFYGSLGRLKKSFETFVARLPRHGRLIANVEDMNVMSVVVNAAPCPTTTFGIHMAATWKAANLQDRRGRYAFQLWREGKVLGRVRLLVPGYHNVKNALAAAATAHESGAHPRDIVKGLATFTGVERRFQVVGRVHGITLVNDYSHHPTEIRALLSTARKTYPDARIVCVFQPHQGSRTRVLMEDFARAFIHADHVILPEIYFVRDTEEERGLVSSKNLAGRMRDLGVDARFIPYRKVIGHLIRTLGRGDLLLIVGAGPVGELPRELVARLERERRSRFLPARSTVLPPALSGLPAEKKREPSVIRS